ncbi:hypothetical protein SAMN05421813_10220 [Daejeonella rubra]|uniref:CHASE2 domain-containing protein n=1 Tax=Daejeonella rubra TaxID=990371 RepID=A0A1G9MMN7_9SPHI|nr:hypothetical protein [Daejeonella rubra]SDL74915.1 hypothetical protein SAMN05421813_10220 [Daejeonella rubra]
MKNILGRLIISAFHGFLLLLLTWAWLGSYMTYGDEFLLVKWSSTVKRVFLNIDEDPPANRFLFIDLAYDKAIIPREDGPGNEVITDRAQLSRFFEISGRQQNVARYIFCDVFLQGRSEWDDSLELSVAKNANLIFPIHKDENGLLLKPELNVPYGIADYQSNRGNTFLKFKLFQDSSYHTVPVEMYKKLNDKSFESGLFFNYDKGLPILNSVIIDYPIRNYELMDEQEYALISLSELLMLPEEVIINEYLKNRIVLMGDFKNDSHQTIFGPMAGTLILLNTFLTLEGGQHRLPLTWFLFLIIAYTNLSYFVFFAQKNHQNISGKQNEIVQRYPFLLSLIGYLVILSSFSIFSYLIFGVHINILIIALYLNVLGLIRNLREHSGWKEAAKNWLIYIKNEYFKFY